MIKKLHEITGSESHPKLNTVIVFNNTDAHVIKVLQDINYHRALNELSGKEIDIYYAAVLAGSYQMPRMTPGIYSFLVPVWKEPASNKPLLALFDLESSSSTPCLVSFLFHEGEVYHENVPIADETEQQVFNSIKEIIIKLRGKIDKYDRSLDKIKAAKETMNKHNRLNKIQDFMRKIGEIRGAIGI